MKNKEEVYCLAGKFNSREEWAKSHRKILKFLNWSFIAISIGVIGGTIFFNLK